MVVLGHMVGGKPEKATNKSLGLVGGGGLHGGWKARKTNQKVTGTHWWWLWWVDGGNVGGCGDGHALVVVVSSHHCQYLSISLVKSKK